MAGHASAHRSPRSGQRFRRAARQILRPVGNEDAAGNDSGTGQEPERRRRPRSAKSARRAAIAGPPNGPRRSTSKTFRDASTCVRPAAPSSARPKCSISRSATRPRSGQRPGRRLVRPARAPHAAAPRPACPGHDRRAGADRRDGRRRSGDPNGRLSAFEAKIGPDLVELRNLNAEVGTQGGVSQELQSIEAERRANEATHRENVRLLKLLTVAEDDSNNCLPRPAACSARSRP